MRRFAHVFSALLFLPLSVQAAELPLLQNGDISAWEYKTFDDIAETSYQTITAAGGQQVLQATSNGGASGYVQWRDISLYDTPWLHFRWRVLQADNNTAEKTKAGDDFAVRLYFVGKSGMSYRTLNLVYAQTAASGEHWESPYAGFMRSIYLYPLASTPANGEWQTTTLNVGEVWRNFFDDDGEVGLVGIMTDGDNAGLTMQAEYGDIVLSANKAR